ncbi:MAG: hypothetical protein J5I93_29920 [Pirellulaceae bacterium]|nr:hypothetical protein [Pirellulaceae bacterium]
MITRIGIGLLVVGVAMFFGSCFLFGSVGLRAAAANKALSVAIEPGQPVTTDVVTVDTSRLCSISVHVKVQSNKVYTNSTIDPQTHKSVEQHTLQYDFPIRYRVLDSAGNVLHEQRERVAWNSGVRTGGGGTVSSAEGGMIENEHHFAKFKVGAPGRVQVDIALDPDTEYGATLQSATLIVYDNVSRHGGPVLNGFVMLCFAPLVLLLGAAFTIVGLVRSSPRRVVETMP